MRSILIVAAMMAGAAKTMAQDTVRTVPQPPAFDFGPDIVGIVIKLIISLVVIIGLIYGSIFLLRRISNRTLPQANQWIKVVGRSYLTPKQSLYIVKMGQKFAILGVGDNAVNLIKELTPEEAETLDKPAEKTTEFAAVFRSLLRK